MSLLCDNLNIIANYAGFAQDLSVPKVFNKYDDSELQEKIYSFRQPFEGLYLRNGEDLQGIYPEEISIDNNIIYYMVMASYNISLLKNGNPEPGAIAKARAGIMNTKKYSDEIYNLFDLKTLKNTEFKKGCLQSFNDLEEAIIIVRSIIGNGVDSSDIESVSAFLALLHVYHDKFKVVTESNNSNIEVFERIRNCLVSMQNLTDMASDFFSLNKYPSALNMLDDFSKKNTDLLAFSDDIRPCSSGT